VRTARDVEDVELIERDECIRLLATQEVGRIGFVDHGAPDVLPVNYALDGDAIVFATATGAKFWAAERAQVAFEVDATDPIAKTGWSVVVHGQAQEVTTLDAPDLLRRVRELRVDPWAGGDRPHLVRIAPRTISGRRVGYGRPRTGGGGAT
jgi:nitroimidazol reductase NimA-like FMN-containing flavoprotein (pyridoxamine 5'-phosphate oxidase superfamily)